VLDDARYSKNSDIWSLGCILFELVTGKRAFSGDWAVREYLLDASQVVSVRFPSAFFQHHFSENLQELLSRDWKQRPSAINALAIFSSYRQFCDLSVADMLYELPSYPSYQQWKEIFESPPNEPQMILHLVECYEKIGEHTTAVSLFGAMVQGYVNDRTWTFAIHRVKAGTMGLRLTKTLVANDFRSDEFALCKAAIEVRPDSVAIRKCLADLYLEKGDYKDAILQFMVAIQGRPFDFRLWHDLSEAYISASDLDGAIEVCKEGLAKYPTSLSPLMVLGNLYAAQSRFTDAVAVQKMLIRFITKHLKAQLSDYDGQLSSYYDALADKYDTLIK
jgi:tetratricopeptide (TPR) repeat protein